MTSASHLSSAPPEQRPGESSHYRWGTTPKKAILLSQLPIGTRCCTNHLAYFGFTSHVRGHRLLVKKVPHRMAHFLEPESDESVSQREEERDPSLPS